MDRSPRRSRVCRVRREGRRDRRSSRARRRDRRAATVMPPPSASWCLRGSRRLCGAVAGAIRAARRLCLAAGSTRSRGCAWRYRRSPRSGAVAAGSAPPRARLRDAAPERVRPVSPPTRGISPNPGPVRDEHRDAVGGEFLRLLGARVAGVGEPSAARGRRRHRARDGPRRPSPPDGRSPVRRPSTAQGSARMIHPRGPRPARVRRLDTRFRRSAGSVETEHSGDLAALSVRTPQ